MTNKSTIEACPNCNGIIRTTRRDANTIQKRCGSCGDWELIDDTEATEDDSADPGDADGEHSSALESAGMGDEDYVDLGENDYFEDGFES